MSALKFNSKICKCGGFALDISFRSFDVNNENLDHSTLKIRDVSSLTQHL